MDEWLSLFDLSILSNSTFDQLANASYHIVIEGTSYRQRLYPHQRLLGPKEVIELNQDLFTVLNSRLQGGSMSLALNMRTPNSPPP